MLDNLGASAKRLKDKGGLHILCGSILVKLTAFLGSIVLVRFLSKSDYGALSYMESLYTYAYLLCGYGLSNAVLRYVVLKDEQSEQKGIVCHAIESGTIFNIVLVVFAALAGCFFPHQEEFSVAASLLPVMLLALPLHYLCDIGFSSLRGLQKNRAFAIFSIICAIMVWGTRVLGAALGDLVGATISWPVAYGVLCVLLLVVIFKRLLPCNVVVRPDGAERKAIRSYSVQYMVTNGLWALFLQNDLMLLGLLAGDASAVASYKVAYAIPAAVSVLSSSIGIFVGPFFIRHENDDRWVWSNYKKLMLFSALAIGAVIALIGLLSEPIVLFLYGATYADSIPIMVVLLVSAFLNNAIRYTAANLLSAMGKVRVNMIIAIFGIVLQVVLNTLLIPLMGAMGAAYTSLVVYAFMAVAVNTLFVRIYRK